MSATSPLIEPHRNDSLHRQIRPSSGHTGLLWPLLTSPHASRYVTVSVVHAGTRVEISQGIPESQKTQHHLVVGELLKHLAHDVLAQYGQGRPDRTSDVLRKE